MLAALLDEGSFGTRVHGKRLLWQLARLVGNRTDVERLLGQLRPEALMKRAQEVVAAPDCPAVTPPSRGAVVGVLMALASAGQVQQLRHWLRHCLVRVVMAAAHAAM